jgi:putative ABC transport system permease protein
MRIEFIHEVASSLRNNKLRTALTGFAVSWGIFLLILLLGAGNGLMNSFGGNVGDYISETIAVEGWYTTKPYRGYKDNRRIQLDQKDLEYTTGPEWEGTIYRVTTSTSSTSATLVLNQSSVGGWLTGAMPAHKDQFKVKLAAGRFINDKDLQERRKVMVISKAQAKELVQGEPETLIGQWVKAGSVAMQVVGIYHTDEQEFRRSCYIPYTTYKTIFDTSDKIAAINFSVNGPSTLEEHKAFQDKYTATLKNMHDIAPDDEYAIWVQNSYTENMQMARAQHIMSIAMWILGLLTLISGIAGVSNIMLITVKERTHEFGIRKAIGAKPGSILRLIIGESVFITTLFGYAGMVIGMIACQIMDKTVGQESVDIGITKIRMLVDPTVGLDVALEATLLLIIAGTIAGVIPAWKAARVKPIEALRAD